MDAVGPTTCPLPEDTTLADVCAALNEACAWAYVVDREWRLVYMTDDIRLSNGALRELVPLPMGEFYFGSAALDVMLAWSGRVFPLETYRAWLAAVGPWLLHDTPGGLAAVRELVDPRLADVVETLAPADGRTAITYGAPGARSGGAPVNLTVTAVRLRDASGQVAGTLLLAKPGARMVVVGALASMGDLRYFGRVLGLVQPARRPAAILFADLEASSQLARRLSTVHFFKFGRRLVRTADQCVLDAGGMVGSHAGDGVAAVFLAEHAGSESLAARACITAMRELRLRLPGVAERSGLSPDDVVLRFGLHWGATLHVGHVTTAARAEVNALGDEMNETARIEACATGGRALASKPLVERLEPEDADALALDPQRLAYVPLAALPSATEKARRDAPAVAVCEL